MRFLLPAFLAALIASQPPVALADEPPFAILQGLDLLDQCSRSSPTADGGWTPTSEDVRRLEALMPSALAPDGRELLMSKGLDYWVRQYIGVVRDGRRYVYGSFFPATDVRSTPGWRTKPIIVCDGGPVFFGIEMDIENETISHIDYNGPR